MNTLTKDETDEAIAWIKQQAKGDKPFFAYVPYNMVHVVLGASEQFRGKSPRGLFGDSMAELDYSVGRILDTLKEAGVDDNTLVVLTSDNGPWVEAHLAGKTPDDNHYGSAGPLRGAKMMTWEGGVRVPGIVRWPGKVPAGVTRDGIVTTMDLLPTFAQLAGVTLPGDRNLDGVDVSAYLLGQDDASPRDTYFYYGFTHLQAVRQGNWKLVLPRPAKPKWRLKPPRIRPGWLRSPGSASRGSNALCPTADCPTRTIAGCWARRRSRSR